MHNNGLCIKQSSSFYLEKYPSWPKGLPWKGSRSLIAARGFKSLLLRFQTEQFEKKKMLTEIECCANIKKLHDRRLQHQKDEH